MARTTTLRLALLLCTLLALAFALASASVPSSQQQQQQRAVANERNSSEEIFEANEHAQLSAAVSGCGLCERTGQCDHAFRGAPGQFCQTIVSGAPCCCPADAQCVLSNVYNCRCKRTVMQSGGGSSHVRTVTHTTTGSESPKVSTLVILLILLCCVCCCCCNASEKRKQQQRERDYYEPVATTQYGTYPGQPPVAQPVYPSYAYNTNPSAPSMYDDDSRYQQQATNSSGFAAGALGAVAGLGAGVFLGSAFSGDNNARTTTTSYFDGDSGGDRGYGGDSVAASTFEFSGDTGGGDGDDGDGDFAGDS